MNFKTMQHRNIPYEYREWTAYNGQKCSAYTCKYFNFYPYHIISFPANTEAEMQNKIDELQIKLSDVSSVLDNKNSSSPQVFI